MIGCRFLRPGSAWLGRWWPIRVLPLVLVASGLAGCTSVGGAPDFSGLLGGSTQRPDGGSSAADPAFPRTAPEQPEEVLGPSELRAIYQAIIETYVDQVDHSVLLEGAVRGAHEGAVEAGLYPLDSVALETVGIRTSPDPARDWEQFAIRYDAFLNGLFGRARVAEVGKGVARGMLKALDDPNTTYLDRRIVEAAQSAGYVGIGVVLSAPDRRGSPIVREVFPGGPAERSGLRAGDAIHAIDGRPTDSITLSQVVQEIGGLEGTTVALSVRRVDDGDREVAIPRAAVRAPPVQAETRDGLAYVRIRSFPEGVADSVRGALAQSLAQGTRGWLIDLRGSSSPVVPEVLDVASIFVGGDVIGFQVDRSQRRLPIQGRGRILDPRPTMLVLVDQDTSGGAEVLAAALKEGAAARLLGTPTAGRVGISRVIQLPDGSAVQITTQRILTPSGEPLQGVGLSPHEPVESTVDDWRQGRDPQLDAALAYFHGVASRSVGD